MSEPAGGLYIAESTKVIGRAIGAGHRPRSVLLQEQGLPDVEDEPGGLTWVQLTDLVVSLFGSPAHCVGASLAIYDPDQDEDHADAAKVIEFIRNALARTTISP